MNRCVDAKGKVNYTDLPCEANQKAGAVNLSGVGKSDVPVAKPNSEKFTTSNRTAAIQAYLAKTEAERAAEKAGSNATGGNKQPALLPGQLPPQGTSVTTEMEKEIARLSKQLEAARSQADGAPAAK
jgi:uncharacterized small protein (DUF1192 family)